MINLMLSMSSGNWSPPPSLCILSSASRMSSPAADDGAVFFCCRRFSMRRSRMPNTVWRFASISRTPPLRRPARRDDGHRSAAGLNPLASSMERSNARMSASLSLHRSPTTARDVESVTRAHSAARNSTARPSAAAAATVRSVAATSSSRMARKEATRGAERSSVAAIFLSWRQ
ncbi:Os06g0639700 [Oryza sativa Japonica Group]|uniref:Os06g0639700 protein n=1 Tax=Oryza sativa subsp. japonica TaxID=39947 RepID=A0A0P0WZ45_ORYSJ|nr:hypothetical protein EE612_035578 [Oryza sativa]BAS98799.1 Os06g0639700 [Oryza sativa Japonica Group]